MSREEAYGSSLNIPGGALLICLVSQTADIQTLAAAGPSFPGKWMIILANQPTVDGTCKTGSHLSWKEWLQTEGNLDLSPRCRETDANVPSKSALSLLRPFHYKRQPPTCFDATKITCLAVLHDVWSQSLWKESAFLLPVPPNRSCPCFPIANSWTELFGQLTCFEASHHRSSFVQYMVTQQDNPTKPKEIAPRQLSQDRLGHLG